MSYVLAFLGFTALIVVHELGHFMAAKAVGMRVERFAIFFPPLLVRVRRGETEYGIGAIPLGGYVKISGMNPTDEYPPEVMGRTYYRQPVWKRVVVIGAGPAMNVLAALALLLVLFLVAGKKPVPVVESVEKGWPAAGRILAGDRIVAVDGDRRGTDAFRAAVRAHRCPGKEARGCLAATPAAVEIERGDRLLTLEIRPRYDAPQHAMRLGFAYSTTRFGAGESARLSVRTAWEITERTFEAVGHIFSAERRKEISGVVGGSRATQQTFAFDLADAVVVLAIISLSLAIINLFPFLPLDGGHIFFSLLEKVRGRAVPFAVMERASIFGFMLVVALFVIGLTNDLGRLMRGEDILRR